MSRICLVGNCRTEFIFDGKANRESNVLGQSNILRMQNSSSSLRNRNVLNRLLQAIDMPKNLPQGQIIMIYPRGAGRNSTLNRAGSSRFQLSSALRSLCPCLTDTGCELLPSRLFIICCKTFDWWLFRPTWVPGWEETRTFEPRFPRRWFFIQGEQEEIQH
jgi:hypothetical protein